MMMIVFLAAMPAAKWCHWPAYDALFIPVLGIFAGSWLAVVVMLLDARLIEAIGALGGTCDAGRACTIDPTPLHVLYAAQARGIIDREQHAEDRSTRSNSVRAACS